MQNLPQPPVNQLRAREGRGGTVIEAFDFFSRSLQPGHIVTYPSLTTGRQLLMHVGVVQRLVAPSGGMRAEGGVAVTRIEQGKATTTAQHPDTSSMVIVGYAYEGNNFQLFDRVSVAEDAVRPPTIPEPVMAAPAASPITSIVDDAVSEAIEESLEEAPDVLTEFLNDEADEAEDQ